MKALLTALVKASQDFGAVEKNTPNAFTKSKYADLSSVLAAVRQPMLDHGLLIVQSPVTKETDRGFVVDIVTTIYHAESGESMEGILTVPATKNDAQGIGSAITYGRRYALVSMLNLSAEDDDGNEASKPQTAKARPQSAPPANGHKPESETKVEELVEPDPDMVSKLQLARLHILGKELYDTQEGWDARRPAIILALTKGKATSSKDLTADQAHTLIDMLQKRVNEKQQNEHGPFAPEPGPGKLEEVTALAF